MANQYNVEMGVVVKLSTTVVKFPFQTINH